MNPNETIAAPGMLLIGASARNSGKTEFSCRIIKDFCDLPNFVAVKVTAVDETNGVCPRGGDGCGVCATLEGAYDITEENDPNSGKDTSRLLAAGAGKVLWMRVRKSHLREGMQALQEQLGEGAVWLCESNSVRMAVRPDVFLMVEEASGNYKESAAKVARFADCIIRSDPDLKEFEFDPSRLTAEDGRWVLKENAAAIVLAGGKSSRMGEDKSMLQVGNSPMIEHVSAQLRRHFEETIISASSSEAYSFLGLPVAVDPQEGMGPLMGIASALRASSHDVNFVTACDVPDIDMPTVRCMIRKAVSEGKDIVVPRGGDGNIEPLHAVYRKSVLPLIDEALEEGERKVRSIYDRCETDYFDLPEEMELVNLNTRVDYKEYCTGKDR